MNTEITWRPENVEENVEMIKSGNSAERQTEDIEDEEEYDVHDKLLGNSKATATAPPPPAISKKKQRQLGPAPIASFEDISDEVRQKMDASGPPSLPGIQESQAESKTTAGAAKLASKQMTLDVTKSTPRIDISRASSSSQHEDSRDSSPENVFDQIGTGTLQDNAIELGFREDGALELRSSTEELYFMEPERQQAQQPLQHQCRSPVTVRIDDQSMDQYQRKDSVSSEVAALLCISGRTSRISSVGSQGSAASRLSAISGISRSPSPHKMILETSFCGPKPVDMPLDFALATGSRNDALEQILLARKHDPTQAVMAEGITIKSLTAEKEKEKKNGAVVKTSARKARPSPQHNVIAPEVKITRPQVIPKASAMEHKKIVGKTENGTEYIRIKLKPDHLYDDQGLAANEEVIEVVHADVAARKPASLNIQKSSKSGDQRKPTASPKPSKHIFGSGSRSPSPATVVTTSRKNSFCSLFKSKETTNTPDSPTAVQARKKSSASARENDESQSHRSRSCGKIKDMGERLSPSPTPSKQKSVLGLFKTKRSGSASKSKSSSPVDHEERRMGGSTSPIAPHYASQQPAGLSKTRLRYYDAPADTAGIIIPLHTPPEEKDQKIEDDAVTRYNQMLDKQLHETELGRSILRSMNKPIKTPEKSPKHGHKQTDVQIQKQDEITAAPKISPLPPRKLSEQIPKIRKSSRIEYPDGSIRIPLRSPSDEDPPPEAQVYQVQVECEPQPVVEPKRRDPPPPAPVAVVKPQSPPALPPLDVPVVDIPEVHSVPVEETLSKNFKVDMVPLPQLIPNQQIEELPQPQPPPPTPASVTSGSVQPNREKKHILFTTKIGSGEEQLFQTQFSVSKTESLCSPTSEANNAQSDNASNLSEDKDKKAGSAESSGKDKMIAHQPSSSEDKAAEDLPQDSVSGSPSVTVQMPQTPLTRRTSQLRCAFSTDEDSTKENSVVVITESHKEPVDVVPEVIVEPVKQRSTEAMDYKLGPQRTSTTEENAIVSSGSDRDSETCTDTTTRSRKHLPHNLAIDEHESTGLVSQISYEDELPYVPTTLPEERAVGVPIIPVKERATMEVKTYPVERPRSTTPLNPSFMDDYCGAEIETLTNQKGDKIKISLPRKDSRDKIQKPKSPRRVSNSSGKSWFEYEARGEPTDQFEEPPPPPLPPRATVMSTTATGTTTSHSPWINFENIPEKRKPPKRITTIPQKDPTVASSPCATGDTSTTVYQFVKPDECQCECHEIERKVGGPETQSPATTTTTSDPDEAQPLLGGSDSNGTAKSAGDGCNSMSDLSTDYSADNSHTSSSSSREMGQDEDEDATTQILNTACESSASEAGSDELLLPICRPKTDSQPQQRPFEFDLSVAHGGPDTKDEDDNST